MQSRAASDRRGVSLSSFAPCSPTCCCALRHAALFGVPASQKRHAFSRATFKPSMRQTAPAYRWSGGRCGSSSAVGTRLAAKALYSLASDRSAKRTPRSSRSALTREIYELLADSGAQSAIGVRSFRSSGWCCSGGSVGRFVFDERNIEAARRAAEQPRRRRHFAFGNRKRNRLPAATRERWQ